MSTYLYGGQNYKLQGTITSTASSITLRSFTEPITEEPITMALMNSTIAYGTISPKTNQSEFISFTGITQNADGTATLTGVTRGLKRGYDYSSSDDFKLSHQGGSEFILSDMPQAFVASGVTGGTVLSVTSANADITVSSPTVSPALTLVQAPALRSATTTVNVSSATAPTVGQGLIATSSTTATWQNITATAGGSNTQLQRNTGGVLGGISTATSDGTNITVTSGGLRVTSPRITTDISDTNGNELIKFTATASAVNEITIANASTGNSPSIVPSGEAGLGLILDTKTGPGVNGILSLRSGTYKFLESSADTDSNGVTYQSYVTILPGIETGTGSPSPTTVSVGSTQTNADLQIGGKGTGTVILTTGATSKSATKALGYSTGAGGAVTQITSRTTGVTLSKPAGAITLVSAAGSTTPATFTVTNSLVAATDVIYVCQKSGTDKYTLSVSAVTAGSFDITFNTKSGTTTEQPVFNFVILKAVTS